MQAFSIAIHGGAGTILRENLSAELEKQYLNGMEEALMAGFEVLKNNGSALDAVTEAVTKLEDNILFNAGKGSVFTNKGEHEMDASIMEGKDLSAGAVAGVKNVRNPIKLAVEVMNKTEHVLLSGEGAMEFAKEQNVVFEPDDYFYSPFRFAQWKQLENSESFALDHSQQVDSNNEKKFGTVGAVACDANGNIAAATSTGGMTNKKFGRVGDSPLIGAGTYANNVTCAISCTGHGELFMKAVAAYDVHARMRYKKDSLSFAMDGTVEHLRKIGGEGGMIGVDANANIYMAFNSDGMYRASIHSNGEKEIKIYR